MSLADTRDPITKYPPRKGERVRGGGWVKLSNAGMRRDYSFSVDRGPQIREEFRYSERVRTRFYAFISLFTLSIAAAGYALMAGSEEVGILSSFAMLTAFIICVSWLERAARERHRYSNKNN